ncbi:unnamed protein product [Didymodactylos carnosus]|uniref:MATH domain-containing protein n=1 Tax=Didymodactylos carnosus TaxID=1234261 RepID=A0A8S2DQ50_9BILA|nr:unnamed protein product [Didymodactylos carnosus]CAF3721963.1 unnamed protein product [Didymodactylos carnosus]
MVWLIIDRGFAKDLAQLHVFCKEKDNGCQWSGILKDYQAHLNDRHKEHELVQCPLADDGCRLQLMKKDFRAHLNTEQHQRSLLVFLEKLQSLMKTITSPIASNMKLDTIDPASTTTSNSNQVNDLYVEFGKCYSTLTTLTQGVHSLQNDVVRLDSESLYVSNVHEVIKKEMDELKKKVVENDACVKEFGPNQEILQQELVIIKQKTFDIGLISSDGTFIWKITNVSNKITDAQTERQISIYSLPFYSSPVGYKMRVCLYLNGDGNARRTHMSLFFVLMEGEYDGILKWPFNHRVTFCLYDQSSQNHHVMDSFQPDIKSNSFQRPHSEMNIASGISKFFPLSMIQQADNNYVKDDTMFIKIIVDFPDLPKMILPFAVNLNPGIPSHVQQTLIKQEIQRRQEAAQTPPMASISSADNQSSCG